MAKLCPELQRLRKTIGAKTMRSLREGRSTLQVWRRTTPHNEMTDLVKLAYQGYEIRLVDDRHVGGHGSGNGHGHGDGTGKGKVFRFTYGYGYGSGFGGGYGAGRGSHGDGTGEGNGHGFGAGSGSGYGSGHSQTSTRSFYEYNTYQGTPRET